MFRINAVSKYLNLGETVKIYYVLAIGVFLSILSVVIYRNALISLTLFLSAIAAFIILRKPPRKIVISLSPDQIIVDTDSILIQEIMSWAMVELEEAVEIVLFAKPSSPEFIYFYMQPDQPGFAKFIQLMSQTIPYNETLPVQDKFHTYMRLVGLV
jgi:hypothetical protein